MSLAGAFNLLAPTTSSMASAFDILRCGASFGKLDEKAERFDRIDVLAEPTSLFTQNMGLFLVAVVQVEIGGVTTGTSHLYQGSQRSKVLPALASWLRSRRPDIVVLTEMWVDDETQSFACETKDVYSHHSRGPHETTPRELLPSVEVEFEKFDGRILILCRHEVVASRQTVYRQCKGEDCFSNKGCLHVRVAVSSIPECIDVFGTHMQSCPPEFTFVDIDVGSGNCEDKLSVHQTEHLSIFIQANSSPTRPAFLLGDLNQNACVPEERSSLSNRLHIPTDLWEVGGDPNLPATSDNVGSFKDGFRYENDAQRRKNGARIDYVLSWPGALIAETVEVLPIEARAEIIQSSPGRDISDHYGIAATIRAVGILKIQEGREVYKCQFH